MSCPMNPDIPESKQIPLQRGGYDIAPDDPNHDYEHTLLQINEGKMDGFIIDAQSSNLNYTNTINMFDRYWIHFVY